MGAALKLVRDREAALGRSGTDMRPRFHEDFIRDGNCGYGRKAGVRAFFDGWQALFRAAFAERRYQTDRWLEDANWVACFGACHARHAGRFMGVVPTGKALRIPYIDFWQNRDGRIAYNKVNVDFADVLAQLGVDVFGGEGWELFDRGGRPSSRPDNEEMT